MLDTSVNTDCIIALDEDNESEYQRLPGFKYEICKTNRRRGATYPLNQIAFKLCHEYDYIGFWGDDQFPRTKDWNMKMYTVLEENKPYSIVYPNDLLQKANLSTSVIMDSKYIKLLGYMGPPRLDHLYIDNFWKFLGEYVNNLHYLDDVIIEHLHYSVGKSNADNLYIDVNTNEASQNSLQIFNEVITDTNLLQILENIKNLKNGI
jgi:hypothetical protein